MSDEIDKNYMSVGQWMLVLFVTALPCIGVIMVLVWAFAGENETRKNYFRAVIAWFAIIVGLVVLLALVGQLPLIHKQIQQWLNKV